MTSDIDSVDWNRFAPYTAEDFDFPSQLRRIVSPDSDTRNRSRQFLLNWPFEGYGRIGAIPDVLQILIQMLSDYPSYGDRAELFKLILSLVAQAPEYSQFTKWYSGTPHELEAAVQTAFAQEGGVYRTLLTDSDPRVRAEAAKALGLLNATELATDLVSQLERENEPSVRKAIVTSLGELRSQFALPILRTFLSTSDQGTLVQAAGAICQISPMLPDEVFSLLIDAAMLGTQPDRILTREQAQAESDLSVEASLLIAKLGEEPRREAAERWVGKMGTLSDNHLVPYCHRMLAWTLRQHHQRGSTLGLTPLERQVLHALADCSRYWTINAYVCRRPETTDEVVVSARQERSYLLGTLYGLPETQAGMKKLLNEPSGQPPP
jgi:hypothetical protein